MSVVFTAKVQLAIILRVFSVTCFIKKLAQSALHDQAHWSFIQKTICTSLGSLALMKSFWWLYLGSCRNLFLQLFYSSCPAVIFLVCFGFFILFYSNFLFSWFTCNAKTALVQGCASAVTYCSARLPPCAAQICQTSQWEEWQHRNLHCCHKTRSKEV